MMLCRNPWQKGEALYPCGQCLPCRINRRRVWTHRIMLEGLQWDVSAFVTLTYDEGNVPRNRDGMGTLRKRDAQLWLKRLRKSLEPARVRFVLVGEYGDQTWRPHYHAILFGYPVCEFGGTRHVERCCEPCERVKSTWGLGHIMVGSLTAKSAAYVAGYVTKKMTFASDPKLQGREPEFPLRSLGIGRDAMWEVASELLAFPHLVKPDVPMGLRHGSHVMPLGRYLRRKLRSYVGMEPGAPQEILDQQAAEMRPVYEAAFRDRTSLKKVVVAATEHEAASLVNKSTIYSRRGNL